MKRILSILAIFALIMTSLPLIGGYEVNAASVATPAQVKSFTARATSYNTAYLVWGKVKGRASGYIIYRNGKQIKVVNNKTTRFYDKGIQGGRTYSYIVRAVNVYKYWQYYNSRTKKWQNKKPANRDWRGRKKRVATGYRNGKCSPRRIVRTPVAPKSNAPANVATTPQSNTTSQTGNVSREVIDIDAARQEMLTKINALRAKEGRPLLELFDELNETAQIKAEDMDANNYFDHVSPTLGNLSQLLKSHEIETMAAGENIAIGGSVEEAMRGWTNSAGHYNNMVAGVYTHVGIGYKNGYWVQQFANNPTLPTEVPAVSCYRCGTTWRIDRKVPAFNTNYIVAESDDGLIHKYFVCLECGALTPACPHCYSGMEYAGNDINGNMKFKCPKCNYTETSSQHKTCKTCGKDLENNTKEVEYEISFVKNNRYYNSFLVSISCCKNCGKCVEVKNHDAEIYAEAYADMNTRLKTGEDIYNYIIWRKKSGLDSNYQPIYVDIVTPKIECLEELVAREPF